MGAEPAAPGRIGSTGRWVAHQGRFHAHGAVFAEEDPGIVRHSRMAPVNVAADHWFPDSIPGLPGAAPVPRGAEYGPPGH